MLNTIKYLCLAAIIFFPAKTGNAQVCTGSLGAPVVNIDFGHGPDPPVPLLAARSDLRFTTSTCPEGDAYMLASTTANCFNNTWHTLMEDHTPGDVNGYMMLLNPDSRSLYSDTVALCGGTTYEFSAWLLNMDNSDACGGGPGLLRPRVILTIEALDGTVLETYNTGDIEVDDSPNPPWHQYSFFFTLPDLYSDIVMRLSNDRGPGGCGNDLAIDDITIRPCGLALGAVFAGLNTPTDTIHFCVTDNKTVSFNGNAMSGFEKTSFQWQESTDNGNTWTDIAGQPGLQLIKPFSVAGRFQYRITASAGATIASLSCRTVSNALNVLVDAVPVPMAVNTSPVCIGSPVALSAGSGDFYQWSGPAGFAASVASPSINAAVLNNTGEYYVLVTTRGGCIKQDSTAVIVSDFPIANAGRDTVICIGSAINLQASGGVQYSWLPATALSNANIANPMASPATTTSYTVTVGNKYNCTATDNVLLTVASLPLASAGPDISICKGSGSSLQGSGNGKYLWSPSTGLSDVTLANPVAAPPATTAYAFKVTNEWGCTAADSVEVKVFTKPVASAGPDKILPDGQTVLLNGMASGDTSVYFWTPAQFISNPHLLTPEVNPAEDITYTLHVGSGTVCGIATDDVFVHVNKALFVPNVFSPNGDGINDNWNIQAINRFPQAEIRIFNRYGQQVFYSKGYNKPWDGRLNGSPLPSSTYYYTIDRKNGLSLLSGSVLIVR